ncbi:helix-turn-helix transcriptional regulator [Paenibacillus sp. FSL K6-0276]|uniref:helix-turn-helix domain-containing protein n=1 Tax=Paenibacillus sp. FSL K6-0276 TaxID=2921450 RepID=UPI0030EEADD8
MKQMTIRAELADYLKKHGTTINQFAEVSKVNSGTISNIINGNRPIAMQQLDRITEGMGLEEGSYYDLYVDECFVHSNPNWRRLRPFLSRCAELDKLECIARVVGIMMDSLSYMPSLFDTAEDFFVQGKHEAAAMLYQSVAESEKYQHSERLALCQYRLFTIALGEDQDANLRAAVQFEGFVNRLDEVDQLNALKDLANTYSALISFQI